MFKPVLRRKKYGRLHLGEFSSLFQGNDLEAHMDLLNLHSNSCLNVGKVIVGSTKAMIRSVMSSKPCVEFEQASLVWVPWVLGAAKDMHQFEMAPFYTQSLK